MVNVPKERSFPRGGKEERPDVAKQKLPDWCSSKYKEVGNNKKNSLSRNKPQWKKRNNRNETIPEETDAKGSKTKGSRGMRLYTGSLIYKNISEGMLILGTISRILPYELLISLPGNYCGHVSITNISECYTQALHSLETSTNKGVHRLQDMFHIGQHVITKVMKKEDISNGDTIKHKISLSLAPEVIHSDCTNEDVLKGTVFTAAVASVQEKGYVMDLGIKSVRAFLTMENSERYEHVWNKGIALEVGQLVRCLVTSVTNADLVTTVALTSDPKLVANSSANTTGARLQGILPGMHFKVTVVRAVYPSGIQVRLSDNVIGYVPPYHLPKMFKHPKDMELDRVHSAKVLYISPSGTIFFTLKNNVCPAHPPPSPFKAIKAGFITNSAVVWDVSDVGLNVKISKNKDVTLKGFIPVNEIGRKLTEEEHPDIKISDLLLKEFPIDSTVTCRVINYSYMDQYYICTMDEDLIKETFVHPSSLRVGLVVQCVVKEITPKGIVLKLGKKSPVTGFVSLIHVSDVPLRHPEKKFKVGQTCTAKVLSVDTNLLLTLKQALIESKDMLTKFENAMVGANYPGTVKVVDPHGNGILVEFYSKFTAWLPRSALNLRRECDIKEIFHVGHLVYCRVTGKYEETRKLLFTLANSKSISMEIDLQNDGEKLLNANDQANTVGANVIKKTKKIRHETNSNKSVVCQDQRGLKRNQQCSSAKDLHKAKKKKKKPTE